MKRSGFNRSPDWKPLQRKTPMARGTAKLKPVGARAKRMRQGKVAPTAEEAAWMAAIVESGCIVCRLRDLGYRAAEVHHLKAGDRRIGHLSSIALCIDHHRGGAKEGPYISRHPWKVRFEQAYGSEHFLLHQQRMLIASSDIGFKFTTQTVDF